MFGKFKIENNDQRKFVSNLFGIACIAWASPIYNFLINLNLQTFKISIESITSLILCLFIAAIFFMLGFTVLKGESK